MSSLLELYQDNTFVVPGYWLIIATSIQVIIHKTLTANIVSLYPI